MRGAGIAIAAPRGRHAHLTGTSFASPLIAARFALLVARTDARAVAHAWSVVERSAVHLGSAGRNETYGYGYLEASPGSANATATR